MPQRPLDFKTFAEVRSELDRLHQSGYEKLGQWDLAQVCDHLAFFIRGSLDGFTFRVPWLFKVLFGKMVLRRILTQRRMKPGVFTPQKPLPSSGGDEAAAVARLKGLLDRLEGLSGELHPSPFFGRLTPDEWRQMHLIHAGHHLSFLSPKS